MAFVINIKDPSSFKKRSNSSKKLILLVSTGMFAIISILSNWQNALGFAVLILIIQIFKSTTWDKYFITQLRIDNETISLVYKEESLIKELTGHKEDFRLKKKMTFSKSRTPYLAIYYKDRLILKQFEVGEWNEKVFDEVISAS